MCVHATVDAFTQTPCTRTATDFIRSTIYKLISNICTFIDVVSIPNLHLFCRTVRDIFVRISILSVTIVKLRAHYEYCNITIVFINHNIVRGGCQCLFDITMMLSQTCRKRSMKPNNNEKKMKFTK